MSSPQAPFSPEEFDPWAETYDRDVLEQARFPFLGYRKVLDTVVSLAAPVPRMRILDIGTGTANLAQLLQARGCELWCTDFSNAMLEKARQKLPDARFVLHDLREPWPADLPASFDQVVSAYVLHHFDLDRKVQLCRDLISRFLSPGGKLLIADLSFPSQAGMDAFASSVGSLWESEPYWLADASLAALRAAGLAPRYIQVSACAGVYAFEV